MKLTYEHERVIIRLIQRGLNAPQIATGLGIDLRAVEIIATGCRKDGEVDRYRDECLWRAQLDGQRHEAAEYLFVRGVPLRAIGERLRMTPNRPYDRSKKEAYQERQLERARDELSRLDYAA